MTKFSQSISPFFLFILALLIRVAVIFWWQFDGLYGQDPFAYYQQGIAIATALPQGGFPANDFFWPNGYPVLIALSSLFVGQTAFAGQIIALLCGASLAPLCYLISRDLWADSDLNGEKAGVLAALIIAVAGQPILSSVVVMADMPALFWAAMATWAVIRTVQSNQRIALLWLLAAGAFLGLSIISRWIYILITPALATYILYYIWRKRLAWWLPLLAILGGLIVLGPQLWLNLNRPDSLLHSWLLGWHPINFFLREFENIDGHFSYQLPVSIFYAQSAGHPAYIFPVLGLAGLWGLWRLWQMRQWPSLILLGGWLGVMYLFLAGIPYQNFRFALSHYLPLLLLTGFGLNDLFTLRLPPRFEAFKPLALKLLIALSLVGMLLWSYKMVGDFLTLQNQGKQIVAQVEQTLPQNSTVLAFGLTLTLQHYTSLNTLELFYFEPAALQALTTETQPLYLLVDPHNLETQWRDQPLYESYDWLVTKMTLTEVAEFPPFVLFEIRR